MSLIYITQDDAVIGINGGNMYVKQDGTIQNFPKNNISGVAVFGNGQMTTQCTRFCLENGLRVSYFSHSGNYFGSLAPVQAGNIHRLKKQIYLSDDEEFCLLMAKKTISAKIHNQTVLLGRYVDDRSNYDYAFLQMHNSIHKIENADSIAEVMGYEGIASRFYFDTIGKIVPESFNFDGRNRRPPKDPINAMLSFGYSILLKEIQGELENKSLSSYAGFVHKDSDRHPALASDLLEEWRAVIVDSVVLSMVQGHEIYPEDFEMNNDGCYLSYSAKKKFLSKLERKLYTETKYLSYVDRPVSFRQGIWHQVNRLAHVIDTGLVEEYSPIKIR